MRLVLPNLRTKMKNVMIEKEIELRCKEFFEQVNTRQTKIEGEINYLKLKLNSDKSDIVQTTKKLISYMEVKLNIKFAHSEEEAKEIWTHCQETYRREQ